MYFKLKPINQVLTGETEHQIKGVNNQSSDDLYVRAQINANWKGRKNIELHNEINKRDMAGKKIKIIKCRPTENALATSKKQKGSNQGIIQRSSLIFNPPYFLRVFKLFC